MRQGEARLHGAERVKRAVLLTSKNFLCLAAREATATHARRVETLSAELIVCLPFFLVAQHLIRLAHLLEILLCKRLVARVLVGVVLYC